MNEQHLGRIAIELNISVWQVRAVAEMLADGATVPLPKLPTLLELPHLSGPGTPYSWTSIWMDGKTSW